MKSTIVRAAVILLVFAIAGAGCCGFAESTALIRTGHDGIENVMGIFGAVYSNGRVFFNRGFDICVAEADGSAIARYDTANYYFNDDPEAYFRYLNDTEANPIEYYAGNSVISGIAAMGDSVGCIRIDEYGEEGYESRSGIGAWLCEGVISDSGLDMKALYEIEWDGMENVPIMSSCAISKDTLVMRPDDMYIPESNPAYALFFRLSDEGVCRGTPVEIPGLLDVFNGRDGELWCSVLEESTVNIYALSEAGPGELVASAQGFDDGRYVHAAYSPWDDMIYIADNDTAHRIGGEDDEFLLPITWTCGIAPAENGIVVYNAMNGVITDGSTASDTCITVIGTIFNNSIAEDYMLTHPGKQVKYRYMDSVSEIAAAILTQNTDASLFMFSSGDGPMIRNIIDRGYAAEISSEYIKSESGRLYPGLRDYISRDGRLYGACLSINSPYSFVADYYVMNSARIKAEELPTTWMELLDYVDKWGENPASYDYRLFDDGYTGDEIKRILLGYMYCDYTMYLRRGEVDSFDTPEFRALLKRLNEVDFTASAVFEDYYSPLIMLGAPVTCDSFMYGLMPLSLKINDDMDYILPMLCDIALINPSSANADDAQEFLEFYLSSLDDRTRGNMYVDAPDSVRPGDYSGIVESLKADLEMYADSRETADEEVEYLYDEMIDELSEQIAYYEDSYFVYTKESIEIYRDFAQHIGAYEAITLSNSDSEIMSNAFDAYISGVISDDAFISELDRRYAMDILEDN